MGAEAGRLLGITNRKQLQYGRNPELDFSEESVKCPELVCRFLALASTGGNYATKKFLR